MIRHFVFLLLTVPGILQLTFATLSETPIAETPNGKVKGIFSKTNDGSTFMQFRGIPYAKPPTDNLRFAPPEPVDAWTGTWIANSTYICLQVDHLHFDDPHEGRTIGDEDCLYVNVFVPGEKIDETKNYDVIVHIHGGGFMFGSAHTIANPKYFMNRDIVFVTFNYRLGIFGFLSMEDKYLPGNFGMKDQVMALKWIQQNIKSFGGNPGSVTITGFSAGGSSVQFHMLSPMSKGLFHKALSASGSALDPWTMYEAPVQKAKLFGNAIGCVYENSEEFLKCLRHRPASQIVETTKHFRTWLFVPFSPFGLVVDSKAAEPFLPEHPYKLLSEGIIVNDVPWIASLTTDEGLCPFAQLRSHDEYFEQLKENWDLYIALTLHYELTIPRKQIGDVAKKIKEEYLGDREVGKDTFPELIQLASDRLFSVSIEQAVRMHAKASKSPVYLYQYGYTAENIWSLPEVLFGFKEKYGVSHGDDMLMIFDQGIKGSQKDEKIIEFLIDIWVKLAQTGKPEVNDWKAVSKNPSDLLNYLYIGSPENIELRTTNDLSKNKKFWEDLPFAENDKLLNKYHKTEL